MTRVDSTAPAEPGTGDGNVPRPARAALPSIRPALVVVAIAAGLVLLFGIGAVIEGGSAPKPAPHPTHVAGTPLTAEPARAPLRPIETAGTPPTGVLRATVVPKGATRTGSSPWTRTTQFSAKVDFEVSASQAAVVDFYRAELKARGWSSPDVTATQPPKGATELLAQRASADGWYWEVGVVVSPTTFTEHPSRATSAARASGRTKFTLELFEVPDPE